MEIKQITDKKIWQEFLDAHYTEHYPFFQTWNWGEVQKCLGHSVYNLGLYDGKKIIGVIQLVEVKAKRGHYLFWRHGPLLNEFTQESFINLLEYIKQLAKVKKCEFIRLSRFFKIQLIDKNFFKALGFILSPLQTSDAETCWVLNIKKSEDELLRGMRKSHRYLIKKSQTMNIEVIKSTDEKDLELFLPLYKRLATRQHFVAHKGLQEEFSIFVKDKEAMLLLARYEGKIIAGAFIAFVGKIAIYRHGATDENYRTIPASYLLQWEAIKESKKRDKTLYNFWGIAPPGVGKNHPWSGVTLFKTGFGGETEVFWPIMDLPLSIVYWRTYAVDLISKLIR